MQTRRHATGGWFWAAMLSHGFMGCATPLAAPNWFPGMDQPAPATAAAAPVVEAPADQSPPAAADSLAPNVADTALTAAAAPSPPGDQRTAAEPAPRAAEHPLVAHLRAEGAFSAEELAEIDRLLARHPEMASYFAPRGSSPAGGPPVSQPAHYAPPQPQPPPQPGEAPPATYPPAAMYAGPPPDYGPAVRPVAAEQPILPPADAATPVAQAADQSPARSWREQLLDSIAALEEEAHRRRRELSPAPIDQRASFDSGSPDGSAPAGDAVAASATARAELAELETRLRILYLAAARRDDALRPIEQLTADEQEFWRWQLHALAACLDKSSQPVDDRRWRLAVAELRKAVEVLAAASSLEVRGLAFCTRVNSYGSYEPFPTAVFKPDQEVLLYAEIDNFTVVAKPEGYETALQGSYRIFDAARRRRADHTFPLETELCRNRRRDYFIPFRMYLPTDLEPGEYTLQLTVEDVKGNKAGQSTISFRIGS